MPSDYDLIGSSPPSAGESTVRWSPRELASRLHRFIWDRAVTDNLRAASAPDGQPVDERLFGREDVDKCFRPGFPVLRWYGRRVGGLGPGLTSYSADAI